MPSLREIVGSMSPVPGNMMDSMIRSPEGTTGRSFRALGGSVRNYMGSSTHKAGMRELSTLVGMGGAKGLGRLFGPAMLGFAAYEGYQEGGMTGALGGMAKEGALWYGLGVAQATLLPAAAALAGATAIGLGVGAAMGVNPIKTFSRPYVRDYTKRHAKLELGAPVMDQFGTISTMRRRSIQAIQRSHISGRSALGREAFLAHDTY